MVSTVKTIQDDEVGLNFEVELWVLKDDKQELLGIVHLTPDGLNEVMKSKSEKFIINGFLKTRDREYHHIIR